MAAIPIDPGELSLLARAIVEGPLCAARDPARRCLLQNLTGRGLLERHDHGAGWTLSHEGWRRVAEARIRGDPASC